MGPIEYCRTGDGSVVALLLHGGHMHAGIGLGEDVFLEAGCGVMRVSRPGYGRTPLGTGSSPEAFAAALVELLADQGVNRVIPVGISAGGRSAMRLAALAPALVEKLVLLSSVSFAPWPDTTTRIAGTLAFNPLSERLTWPLIHRWFRADPRRAAAMMLSAMTNLDAKRIVRDYDTETITQLAEMFTRMRSGRGFLHDLRASGGDASEVSVPTLIVHSRHDRSVPLDHPTRLSHQIHNSRLFLSDAESHLIWFSPHYPEIKREIREFLEL